MVTLKRQQKRLKNSTTPKADSSKYSDFIFSQQIASKYLSSRYAILNVQYMEDGIKGRPVSDRNCRNKSDISNIANYSNDNNIFK